MGLLSKIILAVDDDPFILDQVARFLSGKGFRVVTTTDPEKVVDLAISERPHLIISDIAMPGIDGLSLVKNLKENAKTAKIPVVLLTSSSAVEDITTGFGAGIEAYLRKPLEWERDWPKLQTILMQAE